jgi:GH25 family lysozyme M1 (1,4-beta-N-acetylmuramidase)
VTAFAKHPMPQPAPFPPGGRRLARRSILALVATLVLTLTAIEAIVPAQALAVSTFAAKCDSVSIRSKPSTSSTRLATIDKGTRVVAVARVSGGSWRTTCAGTTAKGSSWYRLTMVNGKSTQSRYGRTYVYVATSLLTRLYTMTQLKTACDNVAFRTSASTSATRTALVPAGTTVVAIGTVSGGSWSTTCAGKAVSGTTWYKINSVNGRSTSSRYGVSAIYAAKGLFVAAGATLPAAASPSPSPTPSPTASPSPSPAPSSSATPTPSPTPTPSSSATPTPSPSPTPSPTASPSPTPGYIEGIDVSHWQGTINWTKVKAAGKKFAFIKASEHTTFVDNMYATNRAQAKANGILVGAYHFARPDATAGDAVNEADHFINTAGPVSGELLPVLDLEVAGGLSATQLSGWAKSFLDRVYERTGVKGMIYMSPSFWTTYAGNSSNLVNAGYKVLWIAHWTTASSPTVPAGNWGGNGWTFWQYTSSGSVDGIGGRVDLNRYRHTNFTPVLIP